MSRWRPLRATRSGHPTQIFASVSNSYTVKYFEVLNNTEGIRYFLSRPFEKSKTIDVDSVFVVEIQNLVAQFTLLFFQSVP